MIFLLSLIALISTFSFLSLAPFVPTKTRDLERVARILDLQPGETFLEIGSGTAKVSLFLAKKFPESKIEGIELSPLFYLFWKIRAMLSRLDNIDIRYGNALKWDMRPYDVLYVFGLPDTVKVKIFPKLQQELWPHSRFFSYCFRMENNELIEIQHKESPDLLSIYEYTRP